MAKPLFYDSRARLYHLFSITLSTIFKISVTMRDTQPLPLGDIVICHSEQGSNADASEESRR